MVIDLPAPGTDVPAEPRAAPIGNSARTDLERRCVLGPHFFLPDNIKSLVDDLCKQIKAPAEVTYSTTVITTGGRSTTSRTTTTATDLDQLFSAVDHSSYLFPFTVVVRSERHRAVLSFGETPGRKNAVELSVTTSGVGTGEFAPFWNLKLLREARLQFLADRVLHLVKRFALAASLLFVAWAGFATFPSYPYLDEYGDVWHAWTSGEPLRVGSEVAQSLVFAPLFAAVGLAIILSSRRRYWATPSRLDHEPQGWLRHVSGSWRSLGRVYTFWLSLREGAAHHIGNWRSSVKRRDVHLLTTVLVVIAIAVIMVTAASDYDGGALFVGTLTLLLALVVFFRPGGLGR